MRFSERLRRRLRVVAAVQTALILGILYFLLALPVTFVMKLLGHDPLMQDAEDGSYWRDRPEFEMSLEGFMRQY